MSAYTERKKQLKHFFWKLSWYFKIQIFMFIVHNFSWNPK